MKQPRLVWMSKARKSVLSICRRAFYTKKATLLVWASILVGNAFTSWSLSIEVEDKKFCKATLKWRRSACSSGQFRLCCWKTWKAILQKVMCRSLGQCWVLVPGSMVLLEQIADDNVDALVNLGCCLYKVKKFCISSMFHLLLNLLHVCIESQMPLQQVIIISYNNLL